MEEKLIGVVLDTNVVVDAVWHKDRACSEALYKVKDGRHVVVVCEHLLHEYRKILSGNSRELYSMMDRILMQALPIERLDKRPDPEVTIEFGPDEDRRHMQLAIDAGARCHVTKDKAVLKEAANMQKHGVQETKPKSCSNCWQ